MRGGSFLRKQWNLITYGGVWEEEKEPIDVYRKWIRQPSQSGNDMRHHVKVHASHPEQEWESPSASLIEQDPEVVPDVDIATQVGKRFLP